MQVAYTGWNPVPRLANLSAMAANERRVALTLLAHPDDAYLVAHDRVMVADIINCRVVWLNRRKHVVRSLGRAGNCTHDPPTGLLQPNGDTPLPDGGVLVTEIGGACAGRSRPRPTTRPTPSS